MSTQENWKVKVDENTRYDTFTGAPKRDRSLWIVDANKDETVAILIQHYGVSDEAIAKRMSLVSAAPDLLSALKRMLAADDALADEGDAESMSSAIRAAHAAIAKAEGRKS